MVLVARKQTRKKQRERKTFAGKNKLKKREKKQGNYNT